MLRAVHLRLRSMECPWVFSNIVCANSYHPSLLFKFSNESSDSWADFCIAVSKFCACALDSFLLSDLVGGPAGFCADSTGVAYSAARAVLLPLPKGVHNVLKSAGYFRFMLDCTVNPEKAQLAYSRCLELQWRAGGCVSWYLYSVATGETIPVPFALLAVGYRPLMGSSMDVKSGKFHKVRKTPVDDNIRSTQRCWDCWWSARRACSSTPWCCFKRWRFYRW